MRRKSGMRTLVIVFLICIIGLLAVLSALTARSIVRTNRVVNQLTVMQSEIEALNAQLGNPPLTPITETTDMTETTDNAASDASDTSGETADTGTDGEVTIGGEIAPVDIFPSDTYNYLALGNSITKHEVCDYWWGDWGMSATAPEFDYAHQVAAGLEQLYGPVTYQILNFSAWEIQAYDRAEVLMTLDNYLDPDLDLVTLQLGENCYDLDTFENDYIEMVHYIQNKVPDVHVMILGDVWDYPPRDALKLSASATLGIPYADLTGMRDNPLYQCGLGTVVWGADGQQHVVEHSGAAKHPSDAGMKYMADVILHSLNYWDPSVDLPMPG